jgi:AraC-like DNA-binding protein
MQFYTPRYPLSKFIKYYWIVKGNTNLEDSKKTILPFSEGSISFLFINDKGKFSTIKNKTGIYLCPPSFKSYDVDVGGDFIYADATFYPGVLYEKFKIPFNYLSNEAYDIKDLSINIDIDIPESFYINKGNTKEIVNILDDFFINFFHNFNETYFLNNIKNLYTNCSLEDFYNNSTLSIRQVQRNFKKHTGLSPLEVLRISRFHRVLNNIEASQNKALLSQELNFFDQSHLLKEFKLFTGTNFKSFFNNSTKYIF